MTDSDIQILVKEFIGDLENQCIVCHENNSKDNKLCYLIELLEYKKCSCDPLVHNICLDRWLFYKKRCLICNEPVEKKKVDIISVVRITIRKNCCIIVGCICIIMSIAMLVVHEYSVLSK
jgi:hypothetical protein